MSDKKITVELCYNDGKVERLGCRADDILEASMLHYRGKYFVYMSSNGRFLQTPRFEEAKAPVWINI